MSERLTTTRENDPGTDQRPDAALQKLIEIISRSQQGYRELIDHLDQAVFTLSLKGEFLVGNRHLSEILGAPFQDFIGHPFTEFFDSPSLDDARRALPRLQDGAWRGILPFRLKKEDQLRYFSCWFQPLIAGGELTGVIGYARDATNEHQVEIQRSRTEKFAAMGQMLTGAAHELNNPLTAILGVGELLRDRASDDASRRHATIILNQARRAADIVQDLLAFSRPPTQGRVSFQLPEVVRQALNARREELRAKNITVRFHAPDNLPSLEGDPRLLSQSLLNIITNAEQAMSPARDSGTLDVSITSDDRQAVVTIADDGPGITPEDLHKIFDPFFTTRRPGGGTGLGLTISMVVIREHGGTIEVHSQPGAGATFRVVLPFPVQAKAAAPPAPEAATGAPGSLENRSVLVVDDEESIREIVEEGLRARGLLVDCAANVNAALSLLSGHTYDFILCDLNLPGQRGSELFERLCGTPQQPALGFVFMTGDVIEPAKVEELSQRGAHVLNKPFQVSALAALLTQLLHLHPASH